MRSLMMLFLSVIVPVAGAQASFDVASIRPSSSSVQFEHDGEMKISHGTLYMHDVTVGTCIKWAYKLQQPQIVPVKGMDEQHYDIVAKASPLTTPEQMRPMLQTLLVERFGLKFHHDHKEMDVYVLKVAPHGVKMKLSENQDGEASHQNSDVGTVARNFTMRDFIQYMSDPLHAALVDETHLQGQYDFEIDFRKYSDVNSDVRPDTVDLLKRTFQGDLGLTMEKRRATVETFVVDHVAPPTEN